MSDLYLDIAIRARDMASGVLAGMAGGPIAALVVGLGGVAYTSAQMAGTFQGAMFSLIAHAGLAQSQFDNVSQSVMNMSTQVGRSPTELAEAMYPILSAFSGIQNQAAKSALSLDTLRMSFQTVAGTTVNGTRVAQAAVGTFNALGLATNNVGENTRRMTALFDVMDKTVQIGNMQWDAYKGVISKLAVSIKGTSVTFNEASAALAEMTNMGYSARLAQTYLSNTFTTMVIKTDALAKHAKKLGISFDEQAYSSMDLAHKIEYLNHITGGNQQKVLALMNNNTIALKTFKALSTGIDAYRSNLNSLNHAHGALAQSFATAAQGYGFQMARLKAAFDVLTISIGNIFLPLLTQLASVLTPVVTLFAQWVTTNSTLVTSIESRVYPVFDKLGKYLYTYFYPNLKLLYEKIRDLANAFGTDMTVSLHAMSEAFWNTAGVMSGPFNSGLQQIRSSAAANIPVFNAFGNAIAGAFAHAGAAIRLSFTGALDIAKSKIGDLIGPLGSLGLKIGQIATPSFLNGLRQLTGVLNDFSKNKVTVPDLGSLFQRYLIGPINTLWNTFQNKLQPFRDWFLIYLLPAIQEAAPGFANLGDAITNHLLPALAGIGQDLFKAFQDPAFATILGRTIGLVIELAGFLAGKLGDAIKFISPYLRQAADGIIGLATAMADRLSPAFNQIQGVWEFLRDVLNRFFTVLGGPVLQDVFKVAWNWIKFGFHVIEGIILAFIDLFTGNWSQLGKDLTDTWSKVWQDINDILGNYGDLINKAFDGYLGTIIQALEWLWPKMADSISNAYQNDLATPLGHLYDQIAWWFQNSLINKAYNWGSSLISSFLSGITGSAGGIPNTLHNLHVPGFASGVRNFQGGYAVVGEQGPELVYLPSGSSVYPGAGASSSLGSSISGSGGVTIQNLTISVNDFSANMPRSVANALADALDPVLGQRLKGQLNGVQQGGW